MLGLKGFTGMYAAGKVKPQLALLDRVVQDNAVEQTESCERPNILTVRSKGRKALKDLQEKKANSTCLNEGKAYAAAIQSVEGSLETAEEERLHYILSQKYKGISLEFLSQKRHPKKGECEQLSALPVFSCHRITVYAKTMELSKSRICIEWTSSSDPKKGEFYWHYSEGSSRLLLENYVKAMLPSGVECRGATIWGNPKLQTNRKDRISPDLNLSHAFIGVVPEPTQEKIRKARSSFDEMYLIKECPSWKAEEITKDPLIVGIKGNKSFLIDHFDCTDLESYVKKEFSL